MKIDRPVVLADLAKAVDVAVAQTPPVDKLDAQFKRGLGLAHELVFVDIEHAVEQGNDRDRGLTHTDRADLV